MKNLGAISLAMNALLLLLVGNLYLKRGAAPASAMVTKKDSTGATVTVPVVPSLKLVYVNLDTLYEKYTYFKNEKKAFEKKERDLSASLEEKARALQQKAVAFQQKAEKGETARAVLEAEQQQLMQEEKTIMEERDRRGKGLMEETQKFNETLQKKVSAILDKMKADKGYDFVMSYVKGSSLLYVNNSYDITHDVIDALNSQAK
jgi:outer membrane protein